MNELFKMVLSLSLSGGLLILLLLASRPLWKRRAGMRWQYYIWLVVLVRLLLPFAPEANLAGAIFERAEQSNAVAAAQQEMAEPELPLAETTGTQPEEPALSETEPAAVQLAAAPVRFSLRDALELARSWAWLVWLLGALGLLLRKVVLYRSFAQFIRAGGTAVDDPALLDRLACLGERAGVKWPVELYVNPLVASPMLVGAFRPCIVLPTLELSDWDLECTLLHELTHCRRGDFFYKWLVQLALCVHWFNPLVYCMEREIGRACELSCDEAVVRKMDAQSRRAYGTTLLHAVAVKGGYIRPPASAALHEGKELLKERLDAISKYKKHSRKAVLGSLAAALALALCACTAGAYRPFVGGIRITAGTSANSTAASGPASDEPAAVGTSIQQTVKNIEVDWLSGQVDVSTYSGDSVTFSETANRTLSADEVLYYYVDGRTLHIQFNKDKQYDSNTMDGLHKTLTIRVPQALVLNSLEVNTVAAAISVNGASMEEATLQTVSGAVKVSNTAVSDTFRANTVAGNITAEQTGAHTFSANTVSGSIKAAEAEPTARIEMESVIGKVTLALGAVPAGCSVSTTSGKVELTLPKDAVFGAIATVNTGKVSSDFDMQSWEGGKRYTIGSTRQTSITLHTTSGSIAVRAAD